MKLLKRSRFNFKMLLHITALLLIFICSGTPIQGFYYRNFVIIYLIVGILIKLACSEYKLKLNRPLFALWLGMVSTLLLTMIINADFNISHYLGLIISIAAAELFIASVPYKDFKNLFILIATIVSVYSIFITIYSNLYSGFPGTLPLLTIGYNSWRHIGVFYNYWGWNQGVTFIRNAACFREPGVWGCIASLALTFQLIDMRYSTWKKNKKGFIIAAILVIGVVSSFSTTAIFCAGLCTALYLFENKRISIEKLVIFLMVFAAACLLVTIKGDMLFSKFSPNSISYVSYEQRFQGTITGFNCWLRNPLLGSGYTYYLNHEMGTSANSFTDILGKYGIIFFGILIAGLVGFIKKLKLTESANIILFLELVIMLGTQNLLIYPLYLCICFYGLNRKAKL